MNKNNTDSQARGPLWQRLLDILGSMNLAILLLVTLCLITLAGTLTEQNQPTEYYKEVYGPFWTAFFQVLRLFEIYSSPWFLVLVSLLIISIGTCLWRNSPNIVASFGRNSREYHPGRFSRQREWEVETLSSEKLSDLKKQFTKRGYVVSSQTVGEELHIHANRGGQQKLGYLIIHISILIIFLGGLLDGNVFMGINIPGYEHALNSYDVKPQDVPEDKQLPATNTAFSASKTLALGKSENTVIIREKAGYYIQQLPFNIHLSGIDNHYYADGSPKDYVADLEISDPDSQTVTGQVSARQSLSYKGFTISHRGNSGRDAKLTMTLYKFDDSKPMLSDQEIGLPYRITDDETDSIRFDNYKLQNADPSHKINMSNQFVNIGPSIQYHIRNSSDDTVSIEYFLEPYIRHGSKYYLFRVTHGKDKPEIIFLPIEPDENLQKFLDFNHILYEKDLIHLLFASKLEDLFKELELDSDYLQKQAVNQIITLLHDYAQHGREFAIKNQIQSIKEIDQDAASIYMEKMLDYALLIVFKQVLINEEQAKTGNSNTADKISVDMGYFNQLEKAVDQFKKLDIHYFPVIGQHSQEQGVVLAVTRHPGKYVVLGGMIALVIGVLMIFYINYREYLIRIAQVNGRGKIWADAYTNRSDVQFGREFVNLTDVLISVTL